MLVFAAAALATANAFATSAERAKQKDAAENERAALRDKLSALKQSIDRTATEKGRAADALASTESAISKANRALRELSDEQRALQARLAQLDRQQAALANTVDLQQKQLANVLRGQYVSGNEDRLKLLLSGDNPNRINRDLQYFGYVSKAQAALIASLQENLQAVEANRANILAAQEDQQDVIAEQRTQKTLLDQEKARRATLLTQLAGKLDSQRREAGAIARDEQRLSGLVDKLTQLIEQQKKAEAAALEARRKAQQAEQAKAAHARAERERRRAAQAKARAEGKTPPPSPKDTIDDDTPPAVNTAPIPPPAAPSDAAGRAFFARRGQLPLPVQGNIAARFGARRSDGPPWKGLFIKAPEGADVHAVADGQVVFADWLRGFGNLIIVDHGGQYLTIYGNNQAVLKHPGERVKSGDVIAGAGNSGGNEESGLYFEMRHQGRAIDPLGWITTR